MENQDNEEYDFNSVIDTLVGMFGEVMSKDAIITIAESCGGDLNNAADAIMDISSDTTVKDPENNSTNEISSPKIVEKVENKVITSTPQQNVTTIPPPPGLSYAGTSQRTEAVARHKQNSPPDIFTNKTSSPKTVEKVENRAEANTFSTLQQNVTANYLPPGLSYAGVSQRTEAVVRHKQNSTQDIPRSTFWTDQQRQILNYHNKGSRILIFMRGVPGSGKSYLARQLVEMMIGSSPADYRTHICSTDDYFMNNRVYQYDRYRLRDAHDWNQRRVRGALQQGQSPLIIDNTNIEVWEMEPYLREGVKNGYIIEVVEPKTTWARNAHQLQRRNTHNVPITTIKRMLENYQENVTGVYLMRYYGLSYPAYFVPPVLRTTPAFINEQNNLSKSQSQPAIVHSKAISVLPMQPTSISINETHKLESHHPNQHTNTFNNVDILHMDKIEDKEVKPSINKANSPNESKSETAKNKRHLEIQKQLEEMEKFDQEWENSETWDEQLQEIVDSSVKNITNLVPKPPRRNDETTPNETMLDTVKICEDWRQISMFMPPWNENTSSQTTNPCPCPEVPKAMKSSSTFMEIGDTHIQNPNNTLKVISATPRDINLYNMSFQREKIPDKRMLDKSTITNELLLVEGDRCKYEEQHFAAFRKLFKNIPKTALRDVFDKCYGDVNWAVEIVLEDIVNNQLETIDPEYLSDTEEDNQEECNCLAAYNVVPNKQQTSVNEEKTTETSLGPAVLLQKKPKTAPSETSVQLKRQIEKNFVIPDDYYSKHCLKIRKLRRGEYVPESVSSLENKIDDFLNSSANMAVGDAATIDSIQPNTSRGDAASSINAHTSDDEESNASSSDEVQTTVNINVGKDFLSQLDQLFGRKNMTYPDNIVPNLCVPLSLLYDFNAFWVESVMHQMDEHEKQNARMIQEDADFARQISMKEHEFAQAGKEPEVPDFKEIMDMDFAMSLYHKNAAEWRNKEPSDMAAKMTREKLYNLFPDMSPDILAELLVAHDNNFQATVEALLMSTGRSDILEETNGLNKFVMEKEMERQEKLLEEEKKALSEIEWPMLSKGEKVDMAVVEHYREEAKKHVDNRKKNYEKAQEYMRRGMTQAANYYSDIAAFHTLKFEQANSMAATCLMHVHASNCSDNATIDLHYLRVGEAKESLDLFIDTHIQKLKETTNNGGLRYHTLYFITGRGLHSNGRPRVKPAVKKRLRERGLTSSELNPGLLTAKVCANDKLAYQVQVS